MKSLSRGALAVALSLSFLAPVPAQSPVGTYQPNSGHRYPTTRPGNYQFGNDPWTRPGYVANHMPSSVMQGQPGAATQLPAPSPSDMPPGAEMNVMSQGGIACSACGGAGCNQCASGCRSCGGAGCGGCKGRLFRRHFAGRAHRMGGYAGSCGIGYAAGGKAGMIAGSGYNAAEACAPSCGPRYYGSVGGLFMRRDNSNTLWLSFDTATVGSMLLGTRDAEMDWAGGGSATIGWYCGDCSALEATYWGVFDDTQEANAFDPAGAGALNTVFAFQGLDYQAPGNPILGWFDGAQRHRLLRRHEFHNVEINLLNSCAGVGACGNPCGTTLTWIAGLRYFKFTEDFEFWSDDVDNVFTGSPDEVALLVGVQNHLIGFQLGARADYWRGRRWNVYSAFKFGLFANHITHGSFVGGASGPAFVNDATSPYDGQLYNVTSSRNDIAMMGELDFGLNWRMSRCWSTQIGYRALGIAGMALATNQIPMNFSDIGGVRSIDANGHLILHGAYLNATFAY